MGALLQACSRPKDSSTNSTDGWCGASGRIATSDGVVRDGRPSRRPRVYGEMGLVNLSRYDPFHRPSSNEGVFVKAGCGKTARPVWAADGGQPTSGASSDPTPVRPGESRKREGALLWSRWRVRVRARAWSLETQHPQGQSAPPSAPALQGRQAVTGGGVSMPFTTGSTGVTSWQRHGKRVLSEPR